MGLINTYSLGWLRQKSNQYLDTPPDVAIQFGPRMRALLGYMPHGSGDDRIGTFRGDCPAWVDTPPNRHGERSEGRLDRQKTRTRRTASDPTYQTDLRARYRYTGQDTATIATAYTAVSLST